MAATVSIIITSFNKEKYIRRAVRSALCQSFRDIEVVVVDDCSTDDSREIVGAMSDDARLRLRCHDVNMGLSQARLTGIAESTGSFIMFMDADDSIEPHAVARMLERQRAVSADIVVMATRRIGKRIPVRLPFFIPSRFFGTADVVVARDLMPAILCKNGFSLSMCDKLYRRQVLENAGMVAERSFMGEDMLFNMRVFNSDARVAWTDYVGYNWTTGGGSAKDVPAMWEEVKRLYMRCREVLQELDIAGEDNMAHLGHGLAGAFIYEIARSMVNPFVSRAEVKKWIAGQLASPVWNGIAFLPGNEYAMIAKRDAEAVFRAGCRQLSRHRLYYTLLAVM